MEQLVGMSDTIFLGRVGEIELGAAAIAGVYYTVLFTLGFGFSIGAGIIIGRRNGEKDFKGIGDIFWQGTYFSIAISLIIIALSLLLSSWILSLVISSPHILAAAMDYLKWRIFSLVFAYVIAMFRAFYMGTTKTRVLTYSSLVLVLSNIGFNWVLIFGHLGMPAMGISGAAIGSTMAEALTVIFYIIYTSCNRESRIYGLNKPPRFDWAKLRAILKVSIWTMVQNFFSVFTWLIFFVFAEHLGEEAIAISNIVRNVSGIGWMIVTAFAVTGSTLVSNLIGEGHSEAVIPLLKRVLKLNYAILLVVIAVFFLFPHAVVRIFTNIPGLVEASVPSMLVMTLSYLLSTGAMTLFQGVAGTGNTRKVFVLEMIALGIYLGYCILVMDVLKADIAVCWTADSVYALATLLLCGSYLRSRRWVGKKI